MLAVLSDHLSAVNVARFSPVGHVIASGSDDTNVHVYALRPGPARAAFGSKDPAGVENWRLLHSLRGHTSNVNDLAWCPDGARFATSSIDNLVIVWDAVAGRQLAQLAGHQGVVKGVAWDPFNRYVASHGEKDGVFVWSVQDNWALVHKVREAMTRGRGTAAHLCFARSGGERRCARPPWPRTAAAQHSERVGIAVRKAMLIVLRPALWPLSAPLSTHRRVLGHGQQPHSPSALTAHLAPLPHPHPPQRRVAPACSPRPLSATALAQVQQPYVGAPTNTFVARPDWSPDGQRLFGPNAFAAPLNQAAIIGRNEWDVKHQLCGHKMPVTVARANPKLFHGRTVSARHILVCALRGRGAAASDLPWAREGWVGGRAG